MNNNKTLHNLKLISFIAVGVGCVLLPLVGLSACFFLASLSPHHLSWYHLVAVTMPVLTPFLVLLAIIPGFLAWRKVSGKIAALGGLTAVAVPILAAICLFFSNSSK